MPSPTNPTPEDDPAVALVLGAAVWPGEVPSPSLRRRALLGARLYLGGDVSAIIACGGLGKHPPSEAEVIRRICTEAGVPAGDVLLEDRSRRTRENIAFALPLIAARAARRVVLVSDGYHLPRARLIARRLGLRATGAAPPPADTPWHKRLYSRLREVPAFLWEALTLPRRPRTKPRRRTR